jgi:DNA-binding CsgD family transcriptional regulator
MDEIEQLSIALREAGLPLENCHAFERVEFWRMPTAEEAGRYRAILKEHRPQYVLTARHVQVLQLAALGMTNKLIARKLCISLQTVKNHFTQIYARLGVENRASAVAIAIQRGDFLTISRIVTIGRR